MATIQIFDRDGKKLAELQATAVREWVLNDVSRCTWKMSLLDPNCRLDILEYGHKVLIAHDSLPDWVGLIDSDDNGGRIWSSGNMVQITALSAETVFDYGDTPIKKITGSAGSIYKQLIEIINSQDLVTKVEEGEIHGGGARREETLGDSPLTHVKNLAERSGNDWDVTGEVVSGVLHLQANWYKQKGKYYPRLLTEAALEFSDTLLEEQGKIVNDLLGYGDASTDPSRLHSRKRVQASISQVGRRRGNHVFDGNKDKATLDVNTETEVNKEAWARVKTSFSVIDQDGLFDILDRGNSYPFHLDHAGFGPNGTFGWDGTVRITGMNFNEYTENDKVKLAMEGE